MADPKTYDQLLRKLLDDLKAEGKIGTYQAFARLIEKDKGNFAKYYNGQLLPSRYTHQQIHDQLEALGVIGSQELQRLDDLYDQALQASQGKKNNPHAQKALAGWYVEEPFSYPNEAFKGAVYSELEKLVSKADREIRAISGDTVCGLYKDSTANTQQRVSFLKSIEKIIANSRKGGFRYKRLVQIEEGEPFTDKALAAHFQRLNQFVERERPKRQTLPVFFSLKRIPPLSLTPFLIIDNRSLVIEIDAYHEGGNYTFPNGILVIDDEKQGLLIQSFITYFEKAFNSSKATTIEPYELEIS